MAGYPKKGVNKFPTYMEEHNLTPCKSESATGLQVSPEGLMSVSILSSIYGLRTAHSVLSSGEPKLTPVSNIPLQWRKLAPKEHKLLNQDELGLDF